MAVVKADRPACQGYANGVVAESDRGRVEEAARSCPVSALLLSEVRGTIAGPPPHTEVPRDRGAAG